MSKNHNGQPLAAPFPYFGGKRKAAADVWAAFGAVDNYIEPFAGSAAMLLAAPAGKRVETINDFDGMVANFWRAVVHAPDDVAHHADWPVNEADLHARHCWLVRQRESMTERLMGDPDWYDAKIAGWWVWGVCSFIGDGWCSGRGPWQQIDGELVNVKEQPHLGNGGQGIFRQLPHLGGGQGIFRKLPHLGGGGRGVNSASQCSRSDFIRGWMQRLQDRMRDVRVACGDWQRVLGDSVTHRIGMTAVFLDPPYTQGDMDYGAGGMGQGIADDVRQWCIDNGNHSKMRIVLCGHDGEHDALLAHGWDKRHWSAGKGYARGGDAALRHLETLWCSPACVPAVGVIGDLFA